MSEGEPDQDRKPQKIGVYAEDALILLCIALLFWLGVLHRHEAWAQIVLGLVLVVMLVVFFIRMRRVHRAFKEGP